MLTAHSQEMASEERKAADNKIKSENLFNSLGAGEVQAETDAFQCGRCKQRKCRYRQAQTRSADEPMTTFVTCTVCNNRCVFEIKAILRVILIACGAGGSSPRRDRSHASHMFCLCTSYCSSNATSQFMFRPRPHQFDHSVTDHAHATVAFLYSLNTIDSISASFTRRFLLDHQILTLRIQSGRRSSPQLHVLLTSRPNQTSVVVLITALA